MPRSPAGVVAFPDRDEISALIRKLRQELAESD